MKNRFGTIWVRLKNNWPLKLLALLIAIVIWFLVVQYIDKDDTRRIDNIKIQLNIEDSVPAGEGLVLVTDFDKSLSITYKASRDVIAILNTDKITAYVDLSNATQSGEYSFPVKVDTGGQSIEVISQSVQNVTLKFEKSMTAQVKINAHVEGSVAEGYIKNDPVCVPSVLNIEGPESKINKIVSAEVVVSEKEYSQTMVYSCDYEFVDAQGNTVSKDYITADYEKVDVSVSILKTKTLPVTATIVNSSGGYDNNFAVLSIDPGTITVAGSAELLDTMNSYDLGTIDVAEKNENFQQTYVVSLQNGVRNLNDVSSVKVSVDFGNIMTKTVRFSSFTVENVADGQTVSVTDKYIDITFRGIAADIAKLDATNVKLVIDCQNKTQTKGVNSMPVYAVIPEDYKVGVSGKYYVMADVS